MRALWVVLSVLATGCPPAPTAQSGPLGGPRAPEPERLGTLDDRVVELRYEGGYVELELYREGTRITQVARNRYAVPVTLRWRLDGLDNVAPVSALDGVTVLPAAPRPMAAGDTIVLAELDHLDATRGYARHLDVRGRFGDPRAAPNPYVYRLPYPTGLTFSVLQGFHGAFSHRGSNEFAIDFDCPVATRVLTAREGTVVVAHAAAQGAGTTPDYLDYKRTNFVLVLHDDGTLGEYMHLAPSGIEVKPGQRVERGQPLGLSGNTGFSSTPHLHFQVMTAAEDGASSRSFPFVLAVAPGRVEEPVQGRRYAAWE